LASVGSCYSCFVNVFMSNFCCMRKSFRLNWKCL
jgi:hypothetical protein